MDKFRRSMSSSSSILLCLGVFGFIFSMHIGLKLLVMYGHYGTLLERTSVSCFLYEYPNREPKKAVASDQRDKKCPELVVKLVDIKNSYLTSFYMAIAFSVVMTVIAIDQKLSIKKSKE